MSEKVYKRTPEQRLAISLRQKAYHATHPQKHSEETKKKISLSGKGKKKPNRKPRSVEDNLKQGLKMKGRKKSEETKTRMSLAAKERNSIASVQTLEARQKVAQTNKGRLPWNTGKEMSPEFCKAISKRMTGVIRTPEHNAKLGMTRTGDKSHFWKGGIATKNADDRAQAMTTGEYKAWKRSVKTRDNNTCQHKDENCSGPNHVDHIKPWSTHKELRFDVSNGRILCQYHHQQTDTYAGRLFYPKKKEVGCEKSNVD